VKRLAKWLCSVPHLFSKLMVLWCVGGGSVCCAYALRIMSRTEKDPAALLGVILAFFGGELALIFGRDALKGKDKRDGSDQTL
jgi:hypothetical protein